MTALVVNLIAGMLIGGALGGSPGVIIGALVIILGACGARTLEEDAGP